MVSVKPADLPTVGVLSDVGVRVEEWSLPAEMAESHAGPAISHDDLIGFHAAISDDALLEAEMQLLAANVRRESD